MCKTQLSSSGDKQTGKYYHIYNRGVEKRDIFMDEKDFIRFLISMKEFNQVEQVGSLLELQQRRKKDIRCPNKLFGHRMSLVKILCYSLNLNHYHILVEQLVDKGIQKFMQKLGMGYAKYFNKKYNRSGALFQGRYKATLIKTTGQLQKVSCYINGNPEIHKIIDQAEKWQYSSYQDYLGLRNGTLCDKDVILKDFQSMKEYKKLVDVIIKESIEKKLALKLDLWDEEKKYLLEL
ncbi:MAG: transposase [Patescibacteria group bacterium]|nr:transposase [Patescibacteria group bacterium]MBU1420880.1 transposase [Patescibacteria group bacterium]MBU2456780.1 transposase [Patescibacteria group bacterium]